MNKILGALCVAMGIIHIFAFLSRLKGAKERK